ncbi:porin [Aquibium microcysteis]|uniref:porin n=1 Tax=Aquibium microcysteis TaxID=675281 RepID=UPI00165D1D70|nr:porin [Aquibium microcysteis]
MNLRLSLASVAALTSVNAAFAADAIVIAEPEPVEYVRVCDAFGAGFFYIPGTETCLKLDGYVRMQIGARGGASYSGGTYAGDYAEGWRFTTRARLNLDARSETELGTLRGFMRIQADATNNADAAYGMDQAMVQLGGFYVGYTESAFVAPWALPGIARFGILHTDDGGQHASQQRQQIGYAYTGPNGLFGSITLENDQNEGKGYMPDVVGVAGISQGWGGVWGKVAYDESAGEYAVLGAAQYNVPGFAGSSLRLGMFYASGVNMYALDMPVSGGGSSEAGTVEWSVAGSYLHKINAQWSATVGGQYFKEFSGDKAYLVQGAVVWLPVTNFEVRLEGSYASEENLRGGRKDDTWSGLLRFTRYF